MKRLYLLLVLLVLALAGCGSATTTQQVTSTSTNQSGQAAATANAQSASMQATVDAQSTQSAQNPPKPLQYGVGEPVSSGPWVIIVNGLKTTTNSGNEFITPKQGDTYLLITITARNAASNTHTMNPYYFTLRDASGNTYEQTYIPSAQSTFGSVVASQQIRGDLAYEVPTSLHSFVLQFDTPGDYDNSQLVQWTIKD